VFVLDSRAMSEPGTDLPTSPLPARASALVVGGDAATLTVAIRLAEAGVTDVVVLHPAEWPAPRRGEWLARSPAVDAVLGVAGVPLTALGAASLCWNPLAPASARLEPATVGVRAPALDAALAQRAAELGVTLCAGAVGQVERDGAAHRATTTAGDTVEAALLVDCEGLTTRGLSGAKATLAAYRNMTITVHLEGGAGPESLGGAWAGLGDLAGGVASGWGCEDGWYWYVPVPGDGGGSYVLGMVVDPATVKRTKNRYLDERYFLSLAKQVPHLGQLVAGASCTAATSWWVYQPYVAERLAEPEEARLRVGLGARFVDPFLWTEPTEGIAQAAEAAGLAARYLGGGSGADADAWADYEARWRRTTFGSALLADQLTHRVTEVESRSVFWKRRARCRFIDLRKPDAPIPEPLGLDAAALSLFGGAGAPALSDGPFAELRP
jgi:flavin-dependent dehydrogenase